MKIKWNNKSSFNFNKNNKKMIQEKKKTKWLLTVLWLWETLKNDKWIKKKLKKFLFRTLKKNSKNYIFRGF